MTGIEEDTAFRIDWAQLPHEVRAGIEDRLGGTVRRAVGQRGGFSHGLAARVRLANGARVFVKAIDAADDLATAYRSEARTARCLPERVPTPRCRFGEEIAGWFVAAFDEVAGVHPRLADPGESSDVLRTVGRMARVLTPNPVPHAPTIADALGSAFVGWRTFAEQGPPADLDDWSLRRLDRLAELEKTWLAAASGETLLHTDLSPSNMLRRADAAVLVVDWAWACRGAAWVDLVLLAPSFAAAGVDPDLIITTHPVTAAVDPRAIDAVVCAMGGYWATNSRKPVIPSSPKLRTHQRRFAGLARDWLRRRVGWA
ncbi:phosphotransferase [Nocardia brasiliensis]|uniref:phosphotransferase n=1 Tax=Nocardia brasiliensis TaxID=37326 RepID=UPI002456AF0F|nr:phosphotransferase [Nocardia brasiliensis]